VLVALAVFVIGATSVLVAGPGGAPAAAAGAAPPAPAARAVHVAHRGDTMWAIAHEYRGQVAHDAYLEALIRLNGGTRIEVGQAVQLP
jgi:Tfp pilus assembly protein FimV